KVDENNKTQQEPLMTLYDLFVRANPASIAFTAPERSPLSYGDLLRLIDRTVASLNAMGLGRGDNIAIVLPNGPEMAAAFIAMACAVTTAPLNPAYREDEFAFYMDDLKARALVVEEGSTSPA